MTRRRKRSAPRSSRCLDLALPLVTAFGGSSWAIVVRAINNKEEIMPRLLICFVVGLGLLFGAFAAAPASAHYYYYYGYRHHHHHHRHCWWHHHHRHFRWWY